MRTLILITLRPSQAGENPNEKICNWLAKTGYHPVSLDVSTKQALENKSNSDQNDEKVINEHLDNILSSIPEEDGERRHAKNTAKFIIRFNDATHGTVVWGLVCADYPTVIVRWRHRVSRSLEKATEDFVSNVMKNVKDDDLFMPFSTEESNLAVIPVREPNVTYNTYQGIIIPPGKRLRRKARKDKENEWWIFWGGVSLTVLFSILGFLLFNKTQPDNPLRWLSGFFDRLATTFLVSAFISYLSYRFYLNDKKRKSPIDWH